MSGRFTNPHLRPVSSKHVSRHEFFSEDEEDSDLEDTRCENQDRLELLNQLKERLQASLQFEVAVFEGAQTEDGTKHRKKRRKLAAQEAGSVGEPLRALQLDVVQYHHGIDELLLLLAALKLVSTLEAIPISLQPGPPKPPKCYREPDYEDDAANSEQRRQRAQYAAVDLDWIVRESSIPHLPFPTSTPKLSFATVKTPCSGDIGPVAVFERLQPLRRTRPPVARSELEHHPYKEGALPLDETGGVDTGPERERKNSGIPRIQIEPQDIEDR
ncbi:hypothetical protein V5O48_003038 [Marasmius crinis-equi]|uniref:Uncharacterized protein n=1 Tax=Marasmius crinis-equi TaxID=585013 RepID=A0ABR3FU14_9AGAR